jgi:hypothetical protein
VTRLRAQERRILREELPLAHGALPAGARRAIGQALVAPALRRLPFIRPLGEACLGALVDVLRAIAFLRDEALYRDGELEHACFFLVRGRVFVRASPGPCNVNMWRECVVCNTHDITGAAGRRRQGARDIC